MMSYWPDVHPGQDFQPSAQLENDVRRLVNRGGLGGVRANAGGLQVENICINAYNPCSSAIASGSVVTFLDAAMVEGCVQVVEMASGSESTEWGIAQEQIESNQFGSVLVMGAVIVPITGETGDYAVPVGGGGSFARAATGIARILRIIGTASALILVGSASGGEGVTYAAGDGVNSDLLSGGTISGNYVGVGSVTVTPVEGSTNGQMKIACSGGGGGSVPPGTIIAYAGPLDYKPGEFYDDQYFPEGYSGYGDVPAGWLHCHGQAVSRTEYAALFAAIGTVYGAGNGSTTFNVPDFRGSFLRGAGHPSPSCVMGCSVIEEEDEDHPGEYIYKDAGYVEVKGQVIESGEALIDGQTVDLTGALITTSGIVLNGTNYGFSIEISSEVLEVSGAGYVKGIFIPSRDDIYWESQSNMGQRFNPELPNTIGEIWGVSVNGTPYVKPWVTGDPGPFFDAENFYGWVLPFPIKQDPGYSPYATGLTITTYPNYDTFNNVQIFGGTNGIGEDFKSDIGVTAVKFNAYMGQLVGDGSNVYTVGDYIREFQSDPPEEMLTIKNGATAEGTNLPQRHLVHWLIKC